MKTCTITTVGYLAMAVAFTGCVHSPAPSEQTKSNVAGVLRCRELLIVDEHGKNRAQIAIFPASIGKDGQRHEETVLFRLIDQNGRPGVKIGASVNGTGVSFARDSEKREWSGIQILAGEKEICIKLTDKQGQVKTITP